METTAFPPHRTDVVASGLDRRARYGVWALVVYGLLLAASTFTHQPDPATDFAGYAGYVTTTTFLVSHLMASIAGAGVGVIGAVALAVVAHPRSSRRAELGMAAWTLGQAALLAVFGAAAFAQPAIGRMFLGGDERLAIALDGDVYGAPLFATVAVGLLLFVTGSVLLAGAVRRVPGAPRWATHTLWASTVVFVLSGFTVSALQPFAGVIFAVAAAAIALGLHAAPAAPPRGAT